LKIVRLSLSKPVYDNDSYTNPPSTRLCVAATAEQGKLRLTLF